MQENVKNIFKPNRALIKQHLEFVVSGMKMYCEGRLEISYGDAKNKPTLARNFSIEELDEATEFAAQQNEAGKNVYVTGALLQDDCESMLEQKRSRDSDFYACNSIWCDIDNKGAPITAEELRRKYAHFPPSLVVVTGRHHNGQQHLRVHLWWKLEEPLTNGQEVRALLRGIQQTLGGDPATTNECRIMRLGGTVAWPVEGKEGRITEQTELMIPKNHQKIVNTAALQRNYPEVRDDTIKPESESPAEKKYTSTVAGLQPETVGDGRDAYMSDMVYASIANLAAELGRWPSAQEVYDDVWPVYSRKVGPRDPRRTLDDEGRGSKALQQKIKSKLRLFTTDRMRGATLESLVNAYKSKAEESGQKAGHAESGAQSQESDNKQQNDNTQQDKKPDFKLTDWVASKRYTGVASPISWLVEGVFPKGVPVLLAAMGGLGKSFIALDMAIKIAQPPSLLGPHKVLGRDVKAHGKAVLLTAEDSFDSIHRRINALTNEETLKRTLDNLIIIPMSEIEASQLLVKEGRNGLEMTDMFIDLKKQLHEITDLKFIGIDPLQAFVGADITAKPEAAQFMWSAFAKIASQTGATFFATHHMRKDGMGEIRTAADAREGIRGTTGLVDGARAVYVMWQAVNDIGEAIARKIDQPYEPHRFIQGSIVKANDESDHSLMSFYRKDDGLLFCLGNIDTTGQVRESGKLSANQEAILKAIKNAIAAYGRLVTPYQGMKPVMAISFDNLRKQLEADGYKEFLRKEGDTDKEVAVRAKNATTYARNTLVKRGIIAQQANYIWLLDQPAQSVESEELPAQRHVNEAFKNEFD